MKKISFLTFVLVFGLLVRAGGAQAETPIEEATRTITNFHTVSKGVYRGALPDETGMNALRRLKVRTDIDLVTTEDEIDQERLWAVARGMDFVSVPLESLLPISEEDVLSVVKILDDSTRYPVFVHCRHGQDRTGLVVGLHRVFNEKVEPKDAYDEMLQLGFHSYLIFLTHMFESLTGYED